ncbi:LysR family transcriptional regulator [Ralstonia flaminis]|jgi:LysR family transcriptional regulator of abg operon|uniref:HTH-type transcriptional regulator TsaR n=1 Tax=Ralstonia flaminis TaxID=3058597 RepID=A0ABM9KDI8_9RALS|nr:LysR family transcriptional regulator [Ralstonia sp. LMG 18101]CAJ0822868.1 HTH-type transcriptional regulator TsaR [Ralstonia sp. LMG 18101]
MTLQQLHVFLSVVTQGSIHGAARALGVTQPAITASMRELEKTLGVPLLLRSVKGVKLTSYGAVFYRRAKSITADMKRAEDELLEMRGEQAGSVVVGLSELAECSMLQRVFSAYRREGRGALLSFYQTSFSSALGRLFENAMDFAIVTGQRATKFPDFVEARRLFSMPVVLVARPSHPRVHERRMDALTDEEWLLPCEVGDDTDRAFTQYFEFIGLQTPRVSRCLTVSAATLLLQEADLIAPVQYPTFKLKMESHGLVTIPLDVEGVSMSAYLLTRRDHRLSDDAEALLAMFEEVAEEVPFVERDALTA